MIWYMTIVPVPLGGIQNRSYFGISMGDNLVQLSIRFSNDKKNLTLIRTDEVVPPPVPRPFTLSHLLHQQSPNFQHHRGHVCL